MGVTPSSLFRAMTCSKPPPPAKDRPRSVRSHASAEEEAVSTIIAEYESTHPVPPRPDPRALRRDARRADALRRIRTRLVQSVPDKKNRARYMERYFAHRCEDDVALYAGGFGEGPPTFIEPRLNHDFHVAARAPGAPGTPLAPRLVSLDHLPSGAMGPDLRDVALGRDYAVRAHRDGRKVPRFGDGVSGSPDVFDESRVDESDGEAIDACFDSDELGGGDGVDPAAFARRSEPPPPKTLARKRLDVDGEVAQHPESRGVGRWRAYCREEEEKVADLAAFAFAERDAKVAMMRRHYAATLGAGFEDRYEPPRLPRWLEDARRGDFEAVKRHAPWRRAARDPGDETSSSEASLGRSDGDAGEDPASPEARAVARRDRAKRRAILGMDDRSRWDALAWRASGELRIRVADRRVARAEAADKWWGEGRGLGVAETGDGALFLGEDENRHPDNPVRFLDAGRDALATSPAYRRAREKGGLEPAFAAARALKETRARNRAVRERRAARDAERFEARRRAERRRVRKENARRAAAESTRLRLAAERAAAAATASEAAEAAAARRWRSVKAVGKYVKRRAFFRTGKEKEGETAEET